MKRSLTFPVQVTRDIKEDTTHSSVVFSFCVADVLMIQRIT